MNVAAQQLVADNGWYIEAQVGRQLGEQYAEGRVGGAAYPNVEQAGPQQQGVKSFGRTELQHQIAHD